MQHRWKQWFRPSITKVGVTTLLTLITIYKDNQHLIKQIPNYQDNVGIAKEVYSFLITLTYFLLGSRHPVFRILVIAAFWLFVSWVVYGLIWICESAYIAIYNKRVYNKDYKH